VKSFSRHCSHLSRGKDQSNYERHTRLSIQDATVLQCICFYAAYYWGDIVKKKKRDCHHGIGFTSYNTPICKTAIQSRETLFTATKTNTNITIRPESTTFLLVVIIYANDFHFSTQLHAGLSKIADRSFSSRRKHR
jgi:hypothetical protein